MDSANFFEVRKVADKVTLRFLRTERKALVVRINGQKACNFRDISTTKFFPTRPLGCYRDGGQ